MWYASMEMACGDGLHHAGIFASWRLMLDAVMACILAAARLMLALCCRQAEKKAYELIYTPGGSAEEERPEPRKACLYSDKQESILVLRCPHALML